MKLCLANTSLQSLLSRWRCILLLIFVTNWDYKTSINGLTIEMENITIVK